MPLGCRQLCSFRFSGYAHPVDGLHPWSRRLIPSSIPWVAAQRGQFFRGRAVARIGSVDRSSARLCSGSYILLDEAAWLANGSSLRPHRGPDRSSAARYHGMGISSDGRWRSFPGMGLDGASFDDPGPLWTGDAAWLPPGTPCAGRLALVGLGLDRSGFVVRLAGHRSSDGPASRSRPFSSPPVWISEPGLKTEPNPDHL